MTASLLNAPMLPAPITLLPAETVRRRGAVQS
jgi:hypothetical protein